MTAPADQVPYSKQGASTVRDDALQTLFAKARHSIYLHRNILYRVLASLESRKLLLGHEAAALDPGPARTKWGLHAAGSFEHWLPVPTAFILVLSTAERASRKKGLSNRLAA